MQFDIKMLVIACNLTTFVALEHLQQMLPIQLLELLSQGQERLL